MPSASRVSPHWLHIPFTMYDENGNLIEGMNTPVETAATETANNSSSNESSKKSTLVDSEIDSDDIDDVIQSVLEPRAEVKVGTLKELIINTCVEIIPTKGSNRGRQMYVINGEHWSRHKPAADQNVCVLQYTTWDGGSGWNVVGFKNDARSMTIDEKINKLMSVDAAYQTGIAMLLK